MITANQNRLTLKLWILRAMLIVSFLLAQYNSTRSAIYLLSVSPLFNIELPQMFNLIYYLSTAAAYWGIFELFAMFVMRSLRQPRHITAPIFECYVYFFCITNLLAFAVRFFYLLSPVIMGLFETVIIPAIYLVGMFAAFYLMTQKNIIPPMLRARVFAGTAYPLIAIYTVLTLSSMFSSLVV